MHEFLTNSFNEFLAILIPVQEHVYAIESSGKFNLWVHDSYAKKRIDAPDKDLLATLFIAESCVRFYFFPLIPRIGFEKLLTDNLKTVLTSRYAFCVSNFDSELRNDFRNLIWSGVEHFLKKQQNARK